MDKFDKFLAMTDLCRSDPEFRARLRAEPAAALAGQGIAVASGIDFRLVENSERVYHVVLPPNPKARLSDSSLSGVAGGSSVDCVASQGSLIFDCIGL